MTLYAEIQGTTLIKYPYTFDDLQKENPFTNYGTDIDLVSIFNGTETATQKNYSLASVTIAPTPTYDSATQTITHNEQPTLINGVWTLSWTVSTMTSEQISQYQTNIKNQISLSVQKRLDDFAKTRGYDGILSACTYSNSPTQKFAVEGQYCLDQRDATWAALTQLLSEIEAGTRPLPSSYEDIEGDLPQLVWP